MNTLTPTQQNEQRASALRERFRQIKKIVKAAEGQDYSLLMPDLDKIPVHQRHQTISSKLQTLMAETMKILHELQPATTTGTKGKKTGTSKEAAKAAVANLSGLDI